MNCISEGTLRAYRDGELDTKEQMEAEKHLEECADCRKLSDELGSIADRVYDHLLVLDAPAYGLPVDSRVALARFKAQHEGNKEETSLMWRLFAKRWRPVWAAAVAIAFVAACLTFPPMRSLAQKFLETLRVEKVQPLSLDISSFEGNRTLQQMIGQMVSDKVVVTINEKEQDASTVEAASQLAGFNVQLLGGRTDAPQLTVVGQHAFNMTVERARLQDIFNQAGRPDLVLPPSVEGAMVAVQIPRAVAVRYGDCPSRGDGSENQRSEPAQFNNCVVLLEGPSPIVSVPSDLNIEQLAEIGLQLAGMSPSQAKEFCQTVNWKSTLVLPLPRRVQSYDVVDVNGVQGTLINHRGSQGPRYRLIWAKNGMVYCLTGCGDSGEAVALANSLD
ncbi:MAG TPA: zf-HC2 domain-containing protein [Acidobacteriota bacterium]|jgi:hypothetical protein|nr:zf-HC2 domain-containing protein [Acidobacteriota bacterium]